MDEVSEERSLDWSDFGAVLTIEEVARLLRVSRNSCYDAVRTGEFPSVKIGRRVLIPKLKLMEALGLPPPAPGQRPAGGAVEAQGAKVQAAGVNTLPLPKLKPILRSRLDDDLAAELQCGAEMPDGSLWLLHRDGSQMTVSAEGAEITQSLIRVVVQRKPPLGGRRLRW